MNTKEIEELLEEAGTPCVTVILPTHRLAEYREADMESVGSVIAKAKAQLENNYASSPATDYLAGELDALAKKVDYTHSLDGIGMYVSKNYSKLFQFPFQVKEKVIISDSFDWRDLLFEKDNLLEYYLLSISKKHIRLFNCAGEDIAEVKDNNFPMEYHEEFEYAKPSDASSFTSNVLVGYEKDKSVLQEERLKEFLRIAEKNLPKYIHGNTPLIIAGDSKEINDFMNTAGNGKQVIGKVKGNYIVKKELALHAWKQVQQYIKAKNDLLVNDIAELIGKHKAIIGIESIWKAVEEGKGLKLVIEKDYNYTTETADMLIKKVKSKNGNVIFTDNGSMKKYNGVALLLRYS